LRWTHRETDSQKREDFGGDGEEDEDREDDYEDRLKKGERGESRRDRHTKNWKCDCSSSEEREADERGNV